MLRLLFAGIVLLSAGGDRVAAQALQGPCAPSTAEVIWMQRALDAWEYVSWNLLASDPHPLPWIVLFNSDCVFHIAPAQPPDGYTELNLPLSFVGVPITVYSRAHEGNIRLPNGQQVPAEPVATTSLYDRDQGTFFVMALPSVWKRNPTPSDDETIATRMLGVLSHEMAHTRQLAAVNRRLETLRREHDLPRRLSDDIVEERFNTVAGFREAFEAERDVLYRAATEADPNRLRALTAEGIALIRARRARFFQGPMAVYSELEDLFLMMEGLGEWCSFKLRVATLGENESQALEAARANTNAWTQAEGLVLFLLLDRLVPAWQLHVLGDA